MQIDWLESPNRGTRREGAAIDILLLHYTGMDSEEGALSWLCDPRSAVSSHYFVFEDGRVVQMVAEEERAHHAGVSFWDGETDINSRSIGIEIANPGHQWGYRAFPEKQIAALISLCGSILARHPIPPDRVLAHSDVAPTRKEDPGELFPWQRLYGAGIGLWVPPVPLAGASGFRLGDQDAAIARLRKRFRKYGYGLEESEYFDVEMAAVVTAFQRHFRPERVDGIADIPTIETLDRLLRARCEMRRNRSAAVPDGL